MPTRECPHCGSSARHEACVVCNRDMCADCISHDVRGPVCGLCFERHAAHDRWEALGRPGGDFDEWYDKHG